MGGPSRPHRDAISIHALRKEGDAWRWLMVTLTVHFYPRPPQGGRQIGCVQHAERFGISIHALREEGDAASTTRAS